MPWLLSLTWTWFWTQLGHHFVALFSHDGEVGDVQKPLRRIWQTQCRCSLGQTRWKLIVLGAMAYLKVVVHFPARKTGHWSPNRSTKTWWFHSIIFLPKLRPCWQRTASTARWWRPVMLWATWLLCAPWRGRNCWRATWVWSRPRAVLWCGLGTHYGLAICRGLHWVYHL